MLRSHYLQQKLNHSYPYQLPNYPGEVSLGKMNEDEEILAHYGLKSFHQEYWTEKSDLELRGQSAQLSSPLNSAHHGRNRSDDVLRMNGSGSDPYYPNSVHGKPMTHRAMKRSQTSAQPSMTMPMLERSNYSSPSSNLNRGSPSATTDINGKGQSKKPSNGSRLLLGLMETNFNKFITTKETIDNVYAQIVSTLGEHGQLNTMEICEESLNEAIKDFYGLNDESMKQLDVDYGKLLVLQQCKAFYSLPEKFQQFYEQEKYSKLLQEYKKAKKHYEKEHDRALRNNKTLATLMEHAWHVAQSSLDSLASSIWNRILHTEGDFSYIIESLADLLKIKPNPISGRDPVLYAMVSQQKYLYAFMKEKFSYYESIIKSRQEESGKIAYARASPMLVWKAVSRGGDLDYALRGRPEVFAGMQLIEWAEFCVGTITQEIKEMELLTTEFLAGTIQKDYPEDAKRYGHDPKQMGVIIEKLNGQFIELLYSFVGERGERLELDGAYVLIQLHYFQRVADLLPKKARSIFSMSATRSLVDTWILQHASHAQSSDLSSLFTLKGPNSQYLKAELLIIDILKGLENLYQAPQRDEIVKEIHEAFYKVLYTAAYIPPLDTSTTSSFANWDSSMDSLIDSCVEKTQQGNMAELASLTQKAREKLPNLTFSLFKEDIFELASRIFSIKDRLPSLQTYLIHSFPLNQAAPSLDNTFHNSLGALMQLYALVLLQEIMSSQWLSKQTHVSSNSNSIHPFTFELCTLLESVYLEVKEALPAEEAHRWMSYVTSSLTKLYLVQCTTAALQDLPVLAQILQKCLSTSSMSKLQEMQGKVSVVGTSTTTETKLTNLLSRYNFQFPEMSFS
ncbi:exocyst complex subunit Sec5 [Schizosaccharomyces cryophilus OY26]|uniref:Exocyst complex component SEC5 n=1 Tax=Schizosaccharomyces cryophilus (strain OY26 / ATCC MYA-4695 / CBS 11777 / NBRC 106824 / NRRL Y48691) TaxID=653667 RepID=S9VWS7_SCHCR|nr:exocyst complex subunit Sec5 [Schizosaccharomyces cryophilus OY26]EPY52108.1 exocyst complex subunit Sec5 [Schizosaccharomyces cryophilus OY26]